MDTTRRLLQRNTRDGKIGGVAAGLADYFGIDPTLVRLAFVLLIFAGGFGLAAYLVAWLVMPAGGGSAATGQAPTEVDNRWPLGLAVLAVGVVALAATVGFWWIDEPVLWPFALIIVGLGLLLWRRNEQATEDPPPAPPAAGSPDDTTEYPVVEDIETTRVLAAPAPDEPHRRGRSIPIGWLTLAALALSAVVAGALDASGAVDVSARWFLVYAVGLTAIGVAAGAIFGRVRGPLALAVVFGASLAVAWAIDVPVRWSAGERTVSPASTAELADEYRLGAGELVLDLRQLDLNGETRRVEASVSVGKLLVLTPSEATTEIDGHASLGEVDLYGRSEDGVGVSSSADDSATPYARDRLQLDLEVGIGRVEVR